MILWSYPFSFIAEYTDIILSLLKHHVAMVPDGILYCLDISILVIPLEISFKTFTFSSMVYLATSNKTSYLKKSVSEGDLFE